MELNDNFHPCSQHLSLVEKLSNDLQELLDLPELQELLDLPDPLIRSSWGLIKQVILADLPL